MNTCSFILNLLSIIFSGFTLSLLIYDRVVQGKKNKMKLILTPKDKIPNTKDELLYLCFSFSNESALPISILDLQVGEPDRNIFSEDGLESGRLCINPVDVLETDSDGNVIRNLNVLSTELPIVLSPYSSLKGYFAFHEYGRDSIPMCDKTIYLYVTTSRKEYKVAVDLGAANFYKFSYRDDGLIFGECVNGKCYQDTSIPDNH